MKDEIEKLEAIEERLNQDIPWLVEEFDGTIFDNEEQHNKSTQKLIDYADNLGIVEEKGFPDKESIRETVNGLKLVCFVCALKIAFYIQNEEMPYEDKDKLSALLNMILLTTKASLRATQYFDTGQWTYKE